MSATNFFANFFEFQHKRPYSSSHKYKFCGNDINYSNFHMAGSYQPQHLFAAGCHFADFAIAVIFHPGIKTF